VVQLSSYKHHTTALKIMFYRFEKRSICYLLLILGGSFDFNSLSKVIMRPSEIEYYEKN